MIRVINILQNLVVMDVKRIIAIVHLNAKHVTRITVATEQQLCVRRQNVLHIFRIVLVNVRLAK